MKSTGLSALTGAASSKHPLTPDGTTDINAWCPGRSVLKKSNLWLNDFAQMQSNDAVRAAIQSLAGVYIHDYCQTAHVRRRVNECFSIAENRLTQLLNDPASMELDQGSEAITICAILSMQDVSFFPLAQEPRFWCSFCLTCTGGPDGTTPQEAIHCPLASRIQAGRAFSPHV